MASVKIILKQRNNNTFGTLYLQLIKSRLDKTEISLKRKVLPIYWDKVNQKVKKGHQGYSPLNIYLNNEKTAYNTLINLKDALSEPYTVKELVAERKGNTSSSLNSKDLFLLLKTYTEQNPESLKHNTLRTYRSSLASLEEFNSPVDYDKLDLDWILKFERFLVAKGNKVNTISHKMKSLIKIFNLLIKQGKLNSLPFRHYKRKHEESKREFLSPDELKDFEDYVPTSNSQKLVKDMFLFSCYTGLRFSDLCVLTTSNIKEEKNDEYRLDIRTAKTSSLLNFKLPKRAVVIYVEYLLQKNKIYLFPIIDTKKDLSTEKRIKIQISNRLAYFNPLLKTISQKADIHKPITFHSSRHTYATISLTLGIPIQVVSKLLGHKNLKETMIYSKILDSQKDAATDAWDNIP